MAGRAAIFIITFVDDGARQPGAERPAVKCAQTAKGGDEGFLNGVGGPVFISEGAQGDVEERVLVKQDEGIEGIQVAVLGASNEVGFVGREKCESFHTYFIPPACYRNVAGASQFCNRNGD